MDPESKQLLEKSIDLAEENNKILHSIKRSMLWTKVTSVLYWLMIIGISVGAFYFIQPYMNQLVKMYGTASTVLKNFQSLQK